MGVSSPSHVGMQSRKRSAALLRATPIETPGRPRNGYCAYVVRSNRHKEACMTSTLDPSDSSDSGSDVAGAKRHDFDRDTGLDNHALQTGDSQLAINTERSAT